MGKISPKVGEKIFRPSCGLSDETFLMGWSHD